MSPSSCHPDKVLPKNLGFGKDAVQYMPFYTAATTEADLNLNAVRQPPIQSAPIASRAIKRLILLMLLHISFVNLELSLISAVSLGIGSYGVHGGNRLRRQFP